MSEIEHENQDRTENELMNDALALIAEFDGEQEAFEVVGSAYIDDF